MTVSDVVELYRYDRWANNRLLEAASELAGRELTTPPETDVLVFFDETGA